jgi:hypothetical protein
LLDASPRYHCALRTMTGGCQLPSLIPSTLPP